MEIKLKMHASIALEQATVRLERVRHTLASLRRGTADKLQEAQRTAGNELRKFGLPLFIVLRKVTVRFQSVQKTLTRLGRGVIDRPQKLQETRCRIENDLQKLLANSLDAIVVTDGARRLVCANPKALDLFGVSKLNMSKFTTDTFLSHCQNLELRRKWFAIRRDEKYGKCKIRRLDGSSRVAEYIFVANFCSRRDLYSFRVAPPEITRLGFSAKIPISHSEDSRKIDLLQT